IKALLIGVAALFLATVTALRLRLRLRWLFLVCRSCGAKLRHRCSRVVALTRGTSRAWAEGFPADATDFAAGKPSIDGAIHFFLGHWNYSLIVKPHCTTYVGTRLRV